MGTILTIHGEVRWLAAIFAILVLIKFGLGWAQGSKYSKLDGGLLMGYSITISLNMLLGFLNLIWLFSLAGVLHGVIMLTAVGLSHAPAKWKRSGDDTLRFRNTFFCILASIILVFIGVITLRGGWVWR